MKKEIIFGLVIFIIAINLISAGQFTYLRGYYDSLDSSCTTNDDCVVKNVKNCCGYYPMCLNKNSVLNDIEVSDICANSKDEKCTPMVLSYCRCQKIGSSTKKKCVGFTGNPTLTCGDSNCYLQESNSSSDKYCPSDCNGETNVENCIKEGEVYGRSNSTAHCCEGLKEEAKIVPQASCMSSAYRLPSELTCTNCGNGVCETIENECTCPEDCKNNNCPSLVPPICPEGATVESSGNDDKGCAKPGKCVRQLSNGRKSDIKVMPETASENARQRLGELGFNVTLKEVGSGETQRAVYEVMGEKEGKFLGLFKTKYKVAVEVDAETGEVKETKGKPFLVF